MKTAIKAVIFQQRSPRAVCQLENVFSPTYIHIIKFKLVLDVRPGRAAAGINKIYVLTD